MPLTDYTRLATQMTRDDAERISAADVDMAVAHAVHRYSLDRPREMVEDVATIAANLLPLPTAWQEGFSALLSLEYPVGNVPPTLLEVGRYQPYVDPAQVQRIMLLDALPIGATVRARFTVEHVVDVSSDTIPAARREVVCCWAAALLCEQLAAAYSGQGDSTIQADSVDHGGRAREFAARAKDLRKRYYDELGLDPKRGVPAGVQVDWDLYDSRGRDRIHHPRRYR